MAATKKKSSSRGKKNARKQTASAGFGSEIILLIFLAVSILLMVSNFGVGGFIGDAVSSFSFGIFGLMAYLFPILLFIGIAFYIANRGNRLVNKKLFAGVFFFLFCCNLMQLLTEGYTRDFDILEYYRNSYQYHTGGGVVGGLLCTSTTLAFGTIGSYVITIVVLLITLILMTQRSFFGFMEKVGSRIFQGLKGQIQEHKEMQKQRPAKEEKVRKDTSGRKTGRKKETSQQEEEGFLSGTWLKNTPPDTTPQEAEQAPFEIYRGEDTDAGEKESENIKAESEEEPEKESENESKKSDDLEEPGRSAVSSSQPQRSKSSDEIHDIGKEIEDQKNSSDKPYKFPPINLLKKGSRGKVGDSDAHLRQTAKKLQDTLKSFGINVTITNVSCGPTVTQYEFQPEQGVKLSRIVGLADEIKMNLAAEDIRIEAPIPGKAAVGIEVPNDHNSTVMLRDLIQSEAFQKSKSKLSFAVGKDIAGQPVVADITKMPHLLIAGATGSGKSVCINTLIMSILYKASPDEVKLIMVDPKVVELSVYNGIPHLLIPVVTDPKKAAGALNWAVAQMTERYNIFAEYNVRNLEDYNKKIQSMKDENGENPKPLPQIIIIVDELADLMMVASGEVEDAICRLAQLARAAGIHLIIATQRPSVNVITGLIKANMPSRIAFAVSSGVDSRTILDMNGAERLLGKGDMLFYPQGYQKPARLQGAFVTDEEVGQVVKFLSEKNSKAEYSEEIEEKISLAGVQSAGGGSDDRDVHFVEAGKFIIEKEKASIGMLQRMFKIGFNRAARIMDQLAEAGVVGPEEGTKPRKVLMSMEEFEKYVKECM